MPHPVRLLVHRGTRQVSPQSVHRRVMFADPHDRDEHLGHLPPRTPPEVRKPAIFQSRMLFLQRPAISEDVEVSASMRSTRLDEFQENDYEGAQETTEQGRIRIPTDKSCKKEKRSHRFKISGHRFHHG